MLNLIVFVFMFAGWCIRWTLATVFFVAVMAGAGYYVFNVALHGGSYVQVPDVTMRPITDASYQLAERGLEMGDQRHVPDERAPKYYVIAQRPGAGKVVRTGRRVALTVSAGSESLSPPALIGKTLANAETEIRLSSFALGTVSRIAHDLPRDTVIAQDPAPARLVSANARINLLVSDGRPSRAFIMPDLVNKPVQDVLKLLSPLGVKPTPNAVEMPDQPLDVVLDQQPLAGTLIHEGDRVIYTVRASGTTSLPDAQRMTQPLSYVVPNSWFEREVRVDTIDRNGTRVTVFPLERHYVNGLPPRFGSGYTIMAPSFSFIDKVTIEVYLDGQLAQSYYYEGDAEPVVTQYTVR